MENNAVKNLSIENARIIFKNFAGKETQFNRAGQRNFCVIIDDPETAKQLRADGWNIRVRAPRDEDEPPMNYIQVTVRFDVYPPMVVMITGNKKTILKEETISSLDYAEIRNVDLVIRPRTWDVGGKIGVKAYLKSMYVTIEEDVFAEKYGMYDSPIDEY